MVITRLSHSRGPRFEPGHGHFFLSQPFFIFYRRFTTLCSEFEMKRETHNQRNLIDSCMPTVFADTVVRSLEEESRTKLIKDQKSNNNFARNFYVKSQENVSILYADIVGFTNMSSKRTAAELVKTLNDLFGRFDVLSANTHCEKVAILGDCYYACAGCPIPAAKHAESVVELGLGIIRIIREFCAEKGDSVDMRVGIHTGKVLYGIVGEAKYKFDIFSDSVTLANCMETTGIPGAVHFSEATRLALLKQGKSYKIRHGIAEESEFGAVEGGKSYLAEWLSDEEAKAEKLPDGHELLNEKCCRAKSAEKMYADITTSKKDYNNFESRCYTAKTWFVFPQDQEKYEERYKPNAPVTIKVTPAEDVEEHHRNSKQSDVVKINKPEYPKNYAVVAWSQGFKNSEKSEHIDQMTKLNAVTGLFDAAPAEAMYKGSHVFKALEISNSRPTQADNFVSLFTSDMIMATVISIFLVITGCFASGFEFRFWMVFLITAVCLVGLATIYVTCLSGEPECNEERRGLVSSHDDSRIDRMNTCTLEAGTSVAEAESVFIQSISMTKKAYDERKNDENFIKSQKKEARNMHEIGKSVMGRYRIMSFI